jgi:hypothetical protein
MIVDADTIHILQVERTISGHLVERRNEMKLKLIFMGLLGQISMVITIFTIRYYNNKNIDFTILGVVLFIAVVGTMIYLINLEEE